MKFSALLAALVLGVASLSADEGLKDETRPQVANSDESFLTELSRRARTEIKMAELATRLAGSNAVKQLGDRLLTEHSRVHEDMKLLAKAKAVNVWGEPDNIRISELRQLSGEAFDRAYLAEVVRLHEKDIREFEEAAKTTTDPELKGFVLKYLPTMQAHLASVKRIRTPDATGPVKASTDN